MDRASRREIKRKATKQLKRVEAKEKILTKKIMSQTGENPFETVNESKSYWFINYFKTGLKMFPTHTYRVGCFMLRYNPENIFLAGFGYVLKIKDWTIRSKKKPIGAIGNYLFEFRKKKR